MECWPAKKDLDFNKEMFLEEEWKSDFFEIVKSNQFATKLKETAINGQLKEWTEVLTKVVVKVCDKRKWLMAAKGFKLDFLPEARSEYLGIDVIAFENIKAMWPFPVAAIELENSRNDNRIAYPFWKVLNLRTSLRIVFCYRSLIEKGPPLIRYLNNSVIGSMGINERMKIDGETIVVIGYRNKMETFPYGFFKWWKLNLNIGKFELY